jgi:hypothetical protein
MFVILWLCFGLNRGWRPPSTCPKVLAWHYKAPAHEGCEGTDTAIPAGRAGMTTTRKIGAAASFSRRPIRKKKRPAARPRFRVVPDVAPPGSREVSIDQATLPDQLSIRAENVLKALAPRLTGEAPPPGRWTPSDLLLQRLTYEHLSTARYCGPQTIAEIISWAQIRGKTIQQSFHAGKSLSAMWQDTITKFSAGEIARAEIAEALERSTRRRNTRVPVALQKILLQLIRSPND